MKKIVAGIVLASALFAAAVTARAGDIETLWGVSTDGAAGTLSITVASTGCTDKTYFEHSLEEGVLTFRRTQRDACKAMPMPLTLTYTLQELGIASREAFRLGNPITPRKSFL